MKIHSTLYLFCFHISHFIFWNQKRSGKKKSLNTFSLTVNILKQGDTDVRWRNDFYILTYYYYNFLYTNLLLIDYKSYSVKRAWTHKVKVIAICEKNLMYNISHLSILFTKDIIEFSS